MTSSGGSMDVASGGTRTDLSDHAHGAVKDRSIWPCAGSKNRFIWPSARERFLNRSVNTQREQDTAAGFEGM